MSIKMLIHTNLAEQRSQTDHIVGLFLLTSTNSFPEVGVGEHLLDLGAVSRVSTGFVCAFSLIPSIELLRIPHPVMIG